MMAKWPFGHGVCLFACLLAWLSICFVNALNFTYVHKFIYFHVYLFIYVALAYIYSFLYLI